VFVFSRLPPFFCFAFVLAFLSNSDPKGEKAAAAAKAAEQKAKAKAKKAAGAADLDVLLDVGLKKGKK
jgi:hypothetical protein